MIFKKLAGIFTKQRHVAIYMRVSSRSQDHASQEPDLARWAAGQKEPVRWYRDTFTGTTMQRPGWQMVERAIHAGEVSAVVVWRIDRLGRTAVGLAKLFELLQDRNVNLVSMQESVDLRTTLGRMMCGFLASIAQYETETRRERQAAGIAAFKARGGKMGGAHRGQRRKVTAEQVATIKRMAEEGAKVTAIGRAVSLSRPTLYFYLDELGIPRRRDAGPKEAAPQKTGAGPTPAPHHDSDAVLPARV